MTLVPPISDAPARRPTRVLIVDARPLLRAALASFLAHEPAVEVVGEASPNAALSQVQQLEPDVVLLGAEFIADIEAIGCACHPNGNPRFLLLSSRSDPAFVSFARDAGFAGVVLGSSLAPELLTAIAAVAAGRTYVGVGAPTSDDPAAGTARLSARERQVLKLIAEGHATKQIASMLTLSGKTIETHRLRIMRKLRIFSVAELTKYAIRHGLTRV